MRRAAYNQRMNNFRTKLKKHGKKAVAVGAGLIAACSLALGSLAASPDELFSGAPQDQQVVSAVAVSEDGKRSSGTVSPAAGKKLRFGDRLRMFFFAGPSVLRGALLLPFWALGKVLLSLLGLLFTALNPVWQVLLGVLLNAALLFGLFALIFKLLFPNKRLRDFLTRRNIVFLIAGAILLSLTDAILRAFWADYRPISIAIQLAVGLLVLALLCLRIFGKRIKRTKQNAVAAA